MLDKWQEKWNASDKDRWTFGLLSGVRRRLTIPLELDHYTVQLLTDHGDFNEKLHSLRLVRLVRCRCRVEDKTVDHVLFRCARHAETRRGLREAVVGARGRWPCPPAEFLESRKCYRALVRFAKAAIIAKQGEEREIRG